MTVHMTTAFSFDSQGWLKTARHVPSPNCNAYPLGVATELLVIHNISLPPGEFGGPYIDQLFTNQLDATAHPFFAQIAHLQVSAHFLIQRTGLITQYVSIQHRAWHAGASRLYEREGCNDFSIGVELEGTDTQMFEPAQYDSLTQLTTALRHVLPLKYVRGHEDIAPGRKTDPGPCFDWARYWSAANWPASARGVVPDPPHASGVA